jgi:hypothetical protein
MRSKPFFVPLVMLLFAALTFSAVGLGWSERVEGSPAATQPDETVASRDSSVSDAQGDVLELRFLSPAPDLGRDVTIEGNTAKLVVPRWVVGYPQTMQWVGGTVSLEQQGTLDIAPDMKVLDWTRGATSEAPDAQNPELLPYQDLTYVRLRELADSRLEFFWRCRGDIPMETIDVGYGAFIAEELIGGADYAVVVAPTDGGWMWSVSTPGETRFPWNTSSYEDILSASVSQAGDGQLTFEMTTAQDVPAVPAAADGNPAFSWILDQDGDDGVGASVDLAVVVRWNAEPGQWEAAVMGWDGQDYVDLGIAVAFTRSDTIVSATVDVADLGLEGTFYWAATTAVQVGPDEEFFVGLADQAPDSGWVEETLPPPPTPQRIYLPVICRAAAI